jgi:hypothetical protein
MEVHLKLWYEVIRQHLADVFDVTMFPFIPCSFVYKGYDVTNKCDVCASKIGLMIFISFAAPSCLPNRSYP